MRLVTALLATSSLFAAPRLAHATGSCTPSRAMIVLDKSSSMETGTIGGVSKWDIAVNAIDDITWSYESSIELGLMMFPDPDQCAPGSVYVDTGLFNRDAILTSLATPPPASGNWTPMSQTLDVAATVPSLADMSRQRYVVLVTDGWQWCSPYDASTRFDAVDSVANLTAMGVTVYVVGFGAEVDSLALNQMAVVAGTAIPGCDPTSDSPSSPWNCYMQANDAASLEAELSSIAVTVSAEICDGIDNDCNGLVDEDLARSCATACGGGVETCTAGAWTGCTAPAPQTEVCNGLDDDCDGTVDPGCACVAGETRVCGDDTGACAAGTQTCTAAGTWGACAGAIGPGIETCNAIDDDCDGTIDEGDLCPPGLRCAGGHCVMVGTTPPAPPTLGTPDAGPGGNEDPPPGYPSTCGCRVAGGAPVSWAPIALALLVLATFVRRRP